MEVRAYPLGPDRRPSLRRADQAELVSHSAPSGLRFESMASALGWLLHPLQRVGVCKLAAFQQLERLTQRSGVRESP